MNTNTPGSTNITGNKVMCFRLDIDQVNGARVRIETSNGGNIETNSGNYPNF